MKIAIYGQVYQKSSLIPIESLLQICHEKSFEVHIESSFFKSIKEEETIFKISSGFKTFNALDNSFELLISIGGDGTILRAITYIRDLNIPIIGINTGRLGFLATIQKNNIAKAIDEIVKGNYRISERSLLTVRTEPENKSVLTLTWL